MLHLVSGGGPLPDGLVGFSKLLQGWRISEKRAVATRQHTVCVHGFPALVVFHGGGDSYPCALLNVIVPLLHLTDGVLPLADEHLRLHEGLLQILSSFVQCNLLGRREGVFFFLYLRL